MGSLIKKRRKRMRKKKHKKLLKKTRWQRRQQGSLTGAAPSITRVSPHHPTRERLHAELDRAPLSAARCRASRRRRRGSSRTTRCPASICAAAGHPSPALPEPYERGSTRSAAGSRSLTSPGTSPTHGGRSVCTSDRSPPAQRPMPGTPPGRDRRTRAWRSPRAGRSPISTGSSTSPRPASSPGDPWMTHGHVGTTRRRGRHDVPASRSYRAQDPQPPPRRPTHRRARRPTGSLGERDVQTLTGGEHGTRRGTTRLSFGVPARPGRPPTTSSVTSDGAGARSTSVSAGAVTSTVSASSSWKPSGRVPSTRRVNVSLAGALRGRPTPVLGRAHPTARGVAPSRRAQRLGPARGSMPDCSRHALRRRRLARSVLRSILRRWPKPARTRKVAPADGTRPAGRRGAQAHQRRLDARRRHEHRRRDQPQRRPCGRDLHRHRAVALVPGPAARRPLPPAAPSPASTRSWALSRARITIGVATLYGGSTRRATAAWPSPRTASRSTAPGRRRRG